MTVTVPERPPRFDRCPECGGQLDWARETVKGPGNAPERWTGHGAECGCGMRYDWAPNQPHLRTTRRHRLTMAEVADEERGQPSLFG